MHLARLGRNSNFLRKRFIFYLFAGLFVLWTIPCLAIEVEDLEIIPKTILDPMGYSSDLALSPADGSLHVIWVHGGVHGELQYIFRHPDGTWSEQEEIDTPDMYIYSQENDNPRKCCGITVDLQGLVHLVFASSGGSIYYVYGNAGNWTSPLLIADKGNDSIYPDIVEMDGNLYVVFQDAEDYAIHFIKRIDGEWYHHEIVNDWAEFPSIKKGENGMLYMLFRSMEFLFDANHNNIFGHMVPGYTDWNFIQYITDAERRCGNSSMGIGGGKIYVAWNNSTGISGPNKSKLYCAMAEAPGVEWVSHFGSNNQLIGEDTGEPYPCVSVFSDGTVFYFNGKRMQPRFVIWNGSYWSAVRSGPWYGGLPQYETDGRTLWITTTDTADPYREVSVVGIRNPYADSTDYSNHRPVIVSNPDTLTSPNLEWTYDVEAMDEDGDFLTYSLTLAPEGMEIDSITGMMQWIPELSSSPYDYHQMIEGKDLYLIGIKAEDSKRTFDTQYFWLWVYNEPLIARFGAAPLSGLKPLTVQFHDSSTGNINSREWIFGNGGMSSEQHPTYVYQDTGQFTVTLTVTGSGGSDQMIKEKFITVYEPPPAAYFGADLLEGEKPFTVQFVDSSSGTITSWTWDFGDSSISAEPSPTHIYTKSGQYTVSLRVAGPGGADSLSRDNYIKVNEIPVVADFVASVLSGDKPLTVLFTDLSTGELNSWEWHFGDSNKPDGGRSNESNPIYTYEHTGIYSVLLTVSGLFGSDSEIKHNYIEITDSGSAVEESGLLPKVFAVHQNYPNPFNMRTMITYDLPKSSEVRLVIYNTAGERIRILDQGQRNAGIYPVTWNGLNMYGHHVPTGTYIVQFRAGSFIEQKKILLLK